MGVLAKKILEKLKSRQKTHPSSGSDLGVGGAYNRPYYNHYFVDGHAGVYNTYHNYNNGIYDEYNYRPNEYGSIIGETCTNKLEFEGIVLGKFVCPIEGYFSYFMNSTIKMPIYKGIYRLCSEISPCAYKIQNEIIE
jgi:hypothetical protein